MKKDRVSIDITGLREQIDTAKTDPLWGELSLAKKIRILLIERLDQIRENDQHKGTQSK